MFQATRRFVRPKCGADRVTPRFIERIGSVIEIKDWAPGGSRRFEGVQRNFLVECNLRSDDEDRIRRMRPAAELVRQQLLSKPRFALLVPQEAIRYRSRRGHAKRFAQRGKIDIAGVILPVNNLLAA